MADTGYQQFASVSTTAASGTVNFTDQSNAIDGNDATYATTTTISVGNLSYRMDVVNASAGLAAVSGATIDGIEIRAVVYGENSGSKEIYQSLARLIKGGSQVGTNKANTGTIISGAQTYTFGGPTDKWGTTWTDSEVLASNFGFAWQVLSDGGSSAATRVYTLSVKVYYTPAAPDVTGDGDMTLGIMTMTGGVVRKLLTDADLALGVMTMSGDAARKAIASGDVTLGYVRLATVLRNIYGLESALILGPLAMDGGADVIELHTTAAAFTLGALEMHGVVPDVWGGANMELGPLVVAGAVKKGFNTGGSILLGNIEMDTNIIVIPNIQAAGHVVLQPLAMHGVSLSAGVYITGDMNLALLGLELSGSVKRHLTMSEPLDVALGSMSLRGRTHVMTPKDSTGALTLGNVELRGRTSGTTSSGSDGDIVLRPIQMGGIAITMIQRGAESTIILGSLDMAARAVMYEVSEAEGNIELGPLALKATHHIGHKFAGAIDLPALDIHTVVSARKRATGSMTLGAPTLDGAGYVIRHVSARIQLGAMQLEGEGRSTWRIRGALGLAALDLASDVVRVTTAQGRISLSALRISGQAERNIFGVAAIVLGGIEMYSQLFVNPSRAVKQRYRVVHVGTTQGGKYKLLTVEADTKPTERGV